jgi:hypothetical protein
MCVCVCFTMSLKLKGKKYSIYVRVCMCDTRVCDARVCVSFVSFCMDTLVCVVSTRVKGGREALVPTPKNPP